MEASAGDKRPAEEEGGAEVREVKRSKGVAENIHKVAEMVLVLAAMGKMRGGNVPSEAEREIMAEARQRLAEVCETFPPKDVFPREAFGSVIEDLGLNKLKEQRLGFRPPKISIAEKLMFSKRKFVMEKPGEFPLPNTGTSSNPVRASPSDKQISFQNLQPGQVAGTNTNTLPYQLPTSEVRPVKGSSPVVLPNRSHFRVEGRENGSFHPSQAQVQAHSSGNKSTSRNQPWSMQPQYVSSNQIGTDNQVPKVSGVANLNSTAHPHMIPSHQNPQGVKFVQGPIVRNQHTEIGKIIQKILQPGTFQPPVWTPPSRNYMNQGLVCQICQSIVTEVDNIQVCDHCEKGFHVKCLHDINQKGIPQEDWHCLRCLSLSNGKIIAPKYGRVMRNSGPAKMTSDTPSPRSDKKAESLTEKGKVISNGKSPVQNGQTEINPVTDSTVDEPKKDEERVVRENSNEIASTNSGVSESVNENHVIDWIGEIFQVIDEKTYYQSCSINGVVYRVHDHVLVSFENGKLVPSKLQAMWEDSKTSTKWVTVNRFYFPSDLPESVGRPCGLENNEVYGSACESTIMAGLIQGPCDVNPPNKFVTVNERPSFLCKWIYDEVKGLFRDVSC